MALLFCSGFCDGLGGMWDTLTGGEISTVQKRSGTYSYKVYLSSFNMTKTIPTPVSEVYIQIATYITSKAMTGGTESPIMRWKNGTSVLGGLKFNGTNIKVYTGDFSTLVGMVSFSDVFSDAAWSVLEVYVKIADDNVDPALAGKIILRMDGKIVFTFTGDTKPDANTTINSFWFGLEGTWNTYTYFDDIVIDSANWPNSAYVSPIVPNGAGAFSQWTPTSGVNYECVDDIPPDFVDVIIANNIDLKDSYVMTDLPAAAVVIQGLVWYSMLKRSGPSVPLNFKPLLYNGISEYLGTNILSTLIETLHSDIIELNPFTTNPWTPSEINSLEVGIKSLT